MMMEVFRVEMAAVPTASLNQNTSATIPFLMQATVQSAWISVISVVIITHAQTVQSSIPLMQLFLPASSTALWLATAQPASTMQQLMLLNAQPVWWGTQLLG